MKAASHLGTGLVSHAHASQSLVWTHTPVSVAFVAVFVLVVAALGFLAWKRSGYRPVRRGYAGNLAAPDRRVDRPDAQRSPSGGRFSSPITSRL